MLHHIVGDLDEHIGEVSLVVGNSKEVVEMTSEEPTQAEGTTTVAITNAHTQVYAKQ